MDEQLKARVRAMSSNSTEVNMTNCYVYREHFFGRCTEGKIHEDVLIAYWMMAGYLGPIDSVDEAYREGHGFLGYLIKKGILKPSDTDREMIELVVASTYSKQKTIQICRHERSCFVASLGFIEMLDVGRIENVVLTDGMLKKEKGSADANYLSRQIFQSQRGVKYLGHLNSTPNSLKPLLENVDNPSLLMLRGCDVQFFPTSGFTYEKFKSLTVLEMSGSSLLTSIPILHTIHSLTQLRYLYLSDPLIDIIPFHLFSELQELRWLILRGCSCLEFDPYTPHLENLELLDLSYTSTTSIPNVVRKNLTHLFIRDSKLREIPFIYFQPSLQVLDLSGNQELDFNVVDPLRALREVMLEVDGDTLNVIVSRESYDGRPAKVSIMEVLTNLEVIDVSGCQNILELPEDLGNLKNMKELNLSGCSRLESLREDLFDKMSCLVKLDLSATKVKHLPSFANLTSLRNLSLRDLELDFLAFETWTSLSNLVELDLNGLKISSSQELELDFLQSLGKLQILNLSKSSVTKLPDMSKLGSLKELLLADCQHLKVLPDLQPLTSLEILDLNGTFVKNWQLVFEARAQRGLPTKLANLESLDLRGINEIDFIGVPSARKGNLQGEGTLSKAVHIHIVQATNNQLSGFDRFIYEYARLDALISGIQNNVDAASNTNNKALKSRIKLLQADLKYLQQNINMLQGSRHCKRIEELLLKLMDAAANLSAADFKCDSPNLMQLFRVAVQLKIFFPPKQAPDLEASRIIKKTEKPLFTRRVKKESSNVEFHPQEMADLQHSYQSLTKTQKDCLLCFSAFPCDKDDEDENTGVLKKCLVIKKRILIYWWAGEGFTDPRNEENDAALEDSTAQEVKKLETSETIGEQILKVLTEKGFIEPVRRKRWETRSCRMHYSVHSFITAQAKDEGFFDFNKEKNMLTPYFIRCNGNCLLEPQDSSHSSTKLGAKYTGTHKEVEGLRNVLTLFNVNGSVIDIASKWFSKLKQLSVLYLGSWDCSENAKQVEVIEQNFLEDLKKMKQLRLLSLQGLLTIGKLPDSICKLTSLIILDLRECGYLEELPADIGYLKNLTHLDLTNCTLLTKLPKGISLLSKLEVLKGFVISSQADAVCDHPHDHLWEKTKNCVKRGLFRYKNDEICTLGDLVRLDRLRKLSLVVSTNTFPMDEDHMVFEEMRSLRKLKILWKKSFHTEPLQQKPEHSDISYLRTYLHNIEKLELWCFPSDTLPEWLVPDELKSLEKLYIIGGSLGTFSYGRCDWSVKTLRLKYLPNMVCDWNDLICVFNHMSYMEVHQCGDFKSPECGEEVGWGRVCQNQIEGCYLYSDAHISVTMNLS